MGVTCSHNIQTITVVAPSKNNTFDTIDYFSMSSDAPTLTLDNGAPIGDNQNALTAGDCNEIANGGDFLPM